MKIKNWKDELFNTDKTNASKKVWAYYTSILKSEAFNKKIYKIRKECGIPINGFQARNTTPPREWDFASYNSMLLKKVDEICADYELFSGEWWVALEPYIFYNVIYKPDIISIPGLITISDEKNLYQDPFSKKLMEGYNNTFPISLRISPYASTRDIIDFVKKYSATIRNWQTKYAKPNSRIGKSREKNELKTRRNEYILKNSHLKRRVIAEMVDKKFGEYLDEGHISKIISASKKTGK